MKNSSKITVGYRCYIFLIPQKKKKDKTTCIPCEQLSYWFSRNDVWWIPISNSLNIKFDIFRNSPQELSFWKVPCHTVHSGIYNLRNKVHIQIFRKFTCDLNWDASLLESSPRIFQSWCNRKYGCVFSAA